MKTIFKLFLLTILFSQVLNASNLEKVSLQLQWKHQFEFAGFYAAKHQGFYKEAGFDVKFIEHQDNIDQIQEVIDGNKTFGIWGTGLIASALQGKKVVFLANYFKRSPLVLLTQPNIKLPFNLKNKKVMISNMDFKDAGLLNMFSKFEVDLNDIQRIKPTYDINDFIEKKVDAYLAFLTNEPYFLQKKGIQYNVLDPNNYGVEQYDINLFTSKKYLKENPDKTRAFIEASNKGWEYALNNKEELVELIFKEYNTQNKSKASLLFEANEIENIMLRKIYPIGSIEPEKIRKMAELFSEFSKKDYSIDINDFILEDHFKKSIDLSKKELEFIRNNIVKCVSNTSWSPFNLLNEKNELSGIAVDYWELIKEKTALKSSCNIIESWPNVLNAIKNKQADITLSTTKTKEREEYALFTKSYASFPLAVATRNDFGFISDINAIKNMKIAVGKNTSAQKLLLKQFPNINYIETNGIDTSLKLLSTQKVDAVVEVLPVLAYNMNKRGFTNLKIAGNTNINLNIMMMINNDKPILQSIINKAIGSISSEEKQKIYNKWISVKYQQGFDYSLLIKISIIFFIIIGLILYRHKETLKHKNELDLKNQELEKSREELNKSNERLSIAAKASFDLLYEWDVLTDNLTWFGDIDSFLGYEKGEVSQDIEHWLQLIHHEDIKQLENAVEEHRTSITPIQYEYRIKQKDGSFQYWKDQALPILDENNKPVKWIGVCTNQTLQKNREQELIEQSKLASMGEMIGNIAHQWRQPLSIISTISTSYGIKKEFNQDIDLDTLFKDMIIINDNAQYLSKTIDDFRNFIRGNSEKNYFNLAECTNQFLHLVKSTITNNQITVISSLDESININGYPNELIQCFINIFNNAKDAHKETSEEERYFFISQYVEDNSVIIKFRDNAGGIDDDIIGRVFEPYFTTKHQSQGTGIGLSMTYNMIETGMKGNIQAVNVEFNHNNKPYKGAEFTIRLPLNS